MILFHAPLPTLLLLAALLVTVLGACLKKGKALSYAGGFLWAAGAADLLVEGGSLQEVLAVALLLLAVTALGRKGADEG